MTYFAGNTAKFNYGGADVTKLAGLESAIDALNEYSELEANHVRNMGVLGAYDKQRNILSNFELQRDLESMQRRVDDRSTMLDGIGDVISGVGGLAKSGLFDKKPSIIPDVRGTAPGTPFFEAGMPGL